LLSCRIVLISLRRRLVIRLRRVGLQIWRVSCMSWVLLELVVAIWCWWIWLLFRDCYLGFASMFLLFAY
jgi:hypothetical protein